MSLHIHSNVFRVKMFISILKYLFQEKLNHITFYQEFECNIKLTLCKAYLNHGGIIKWTQHIGFSALAGMERVAEGNHGNDLKEG